MNAVFKDSAPIDALVVDDEPLACANLRALLGGFDNWRLVGEAGSGAAALEAIEASRPQVVFLDIRMPGLDGLRVARFLSAMEKPPLVVFATAFEEHALDAFDVEAADYLVKPLGLERFVTCVRRLERRLRMEREPGPVAPQTATPQSATPTTDGVETLAVRSVGRVRLIAVDDIHWIGAAGNYVRLYLETKCYLHRATLSALERQLPADRFVRIHRSTVVNRRQVAELRTSVSGRYQVVLEDGTELEISQRFKQRVFAQLMPR